MGKTSPEDDAIHQPAQGSGAMYTDITGETHPKPEPVGPDARTYIVEEGDTFETIAKKFYGDGKQFKRILDANRDRLGGDDHLQIGSIIRIPAPE